MISEIPVQFSVVTNATSLGRIKIVSLSKAERIKRTLKFFCISLVSTVVFVFLPVVHLVLVPLGILVTLIGSPVIFSKSQMVIGGSGPCPRCQKQLTIQPMAVKWPLQDTCGECRWSITISPHPLD